MARVDAKLAWFDRVAAFSQIIDGTTVGTTPTFTFKFDGEGFQPGGPWNPGHKWELPSLRRLIDNKVQLQLIQHDPARKEAVEIDAFASGIDLRVLAMHPDHGDVSEIVLFDTKQGQLEKEIVAGDYLANRGSIERTVLLNLYPPTSAKRTATTAPRRERLAQLLDTRDPKNDDDRRLLSRGLSDAANLEAVQGDYPAALNDYVAVMKLLEPLVMDPKRQVKREDAEPLFRAALQISAYFLQVKKYDQAASWLPNLSTIAERMIAVDVSDPEYQRWKATAALQAVYLALGRKEQAKAAAALTTYVESQREIQRMVEDAASARELRDVLSKAEKLSASLDPQLLPLKEWRQLAASLGTNEARAMKHD
jgi:hypothetical protein